MFVTKEMVELPGHIPRALRFHLFPRKVIRECRTGNRILDFSHRFSQKNSRQKSA